MKTTYSEAFIEQALGKVFSRGDRTVRSVAGELNVSYFTLKNWMKKISVEKRSGWERETATGLADRRAIGRAA